MHRKPVTNIVAQVMLGIAAGLTSAAAPQAEPQSSPADGAIACRALEARAVQAMSVAVVLFHQAQASDRARLGELLRRHDGASVEFETADGHTHSAIVLRLGACYGRGLLVLSAADSQLAKGDRFWLKFPRDGTPR